MSIEDIARRASEILAVKVKQATDTVFDTETAPGGKPWAALAAVTVARRKRKGVSVGKILQETGAMRASVTVTPNMTGVLLHADSPGGFHDGGTKHMPQRRITPTEKQVQPLVEAAVDQAVAEFGFADIDAAWKKLEGIF